MLQEKVRLKLTDVWIKWMMNNAYSMKNLYRFYDTLSKQETMEKASTKEQHKDVLV